MKSSNDILTVVNYITKTFNCNLSLHILAGSKKGIGLTGLSTIHQSNFCIALKRAYKSYDRICYDFDGMLLRNYFRNSGNNMVTKRCPMGIIEFAFAIRESSRLLGILFVGAFQSTDHKVELCAGKIYDCDQVKELAQKLPKLDGEECQELIGLCSLLTFRLAAEMSEKDNNQLDYKAKIEDYIMHHLHRYISPDDIANELNLSVSHSTALIKKYFDKSLIKLVNEYRLDEAKIMLKKTSFPVSYIAERCGFKDSGYFHRLFKRSVGVTPREFRQVGFIFFILLALI